MKITVKKLGVWVMLGALLSSSVLAVSCGNTEGPSQDTTTTTQTTTNNNFEDIVIAKDVQFSGKLTDQDGNAIAGATVQLMQNDAAVTSAVTDAEGNFSGTAKEGKYTVTYENLPEYHLGISSEVTLAEGAVLALEVENNTPNGSAERPFVLTESHTDITLPAGQKVCYSTFAGSNRTFIIESDKVKVTFNGTEYAPDAEGISFPIVADSPRDHVIFTVENTTDAELELTVVLYSQPGTMENPIVLTLAEPISIDIPKEGIVYFTTAAPSAGTLTVSSDDPLNNISISNRTTSRVTEFSNGGAEVSIEAAEGDELVLSVSSLSLTDSTLVFTVSFEGAE